MAVIRGRKLLIRVLPKACRTFVKDVRLTCDVGVLLFRERFYFVLFLLSYDDSGVELGPGVPNEKDFKYGSGVLTKRGSNKLAIDSATGKDADSILQVVSKILFLG